MRTIRYHLPEVEVDALLCTSTGVTLTIDVTVSYQYM